MALEYLLDKQDNIKACRANYKQMRVIFSCNLPGDSTIPSHGLFVYKLMRMYIYIMHFVSIWYVNNIEIWRVLRNMTRTKDWKAK